MHQCKLPLFSQVELVNKLSSARVASIQVFGDSLVQEVSFNSRHFLTNKIHVEEHQKEFESMCMGQVSEVLAKPKKGEKVVVVENMRLAHKIWHTPLAVFEQELDNYVKNYATMVRNCLGLSPEDVVGIFYGGYPIHHMRDIPVKEKEEYWITGDRMRQYDAAAWSKLKALPNWHYQDNQRALDPYVEASWDGFHFLQVMYKIGGASKLMTLIALDIALAALGAL